MKDKRSSIVQGRHARVVLVFGAMVTFAVGFSLLGESRALAQDDLPTGEEIMERSIEAGGGREAMAKINNRVVRGTITINPGGLEGTITTYQARPNLSRNRIELGGIGVIDRGSDGETVWEINPMMGPRIVTGAERALMLLLGRFDDSDYKDIFESIECIGVEDVKGEPCYVVKLKAKDIEPMTVYFSKESGLTVKSVMTLESQMGAIKVENFIEEYHVVDGLKMAKRAVEVAAGAETHVVIEKVEHNVVIPEDRFKVPDDIQALLDREKAKQD